ncbi:toll/interleukin-1 receptor domain-containing protein [Aliarcobacter butzleri]|uniref:toll/interleukin-1 receptor domain-containing protein n=1 Tax=Aliarcobacter butzleri TaxID=28197 RepID=UPI003ADF92F2
MNLNDRFKDEQIYESKGNFVREGFFSEELKSESGLNSDFESLEEATSHALSCDTFFAHSSDDIELIKEIIEYFYLLGAKPYIDKDDMELPEHTNIDTAKKLKSNIEACKRFVIVVTYNSINSKWVPWELGVADMLKSYQNVAILPIEGENVSESFIGNEYLGIYKQIREKNGKLVVYNPENNKTTSIEEWLT